MVPAGSTAMLFMTKVGGPPCARHAWGAIQFARHLLGSSQLLANYISLVCLQRQGRLRPPFHQRSIKEAGILVPRLVPYHGPVKLS